VGPRAGPDDVEREKSCLQPLGHPVDILALLYEPYDLSMPEDIHQGNISVPALPGNP
jgi:hypothetical protein